MEKAIKKGSKRAGKIKNGIFERYKDMLFFIDMNINKKDPKKGFFQGSLPILRAKGQKRKGMKKRFMDKFKWNYGADFKFVVFLVRGIFTRKWDQTKGLTKIKYMKMEAF